MGEAHYPSVTPGFPASVSRTTEGAVPSPQATTYTLPVAGIYLITVVAMLSGSEDHSMTGLFFSVFSNQTNDVLSTQQIGTTVKAAGSAFLLDTLTASDPDSTGEITFEAAWANGVDKSIVWAIRTRKLAPFGS